MKRFVLSAIVLALLSNCLTLHSQSQKANGEVLEQSVPSIPSNEEINDLLGKADEYVQQYQAMFKSAKATLDKSPTPGFNAKADELCAQAESLITAIQKNGPTAFSLVGLIVVLDDMSINAARASSMAMFVSVEDNSSQSKQALRDFPDLAQAEKNCIDISELILHPTLRLIAAEERILRTISSQQKPK
jgi:hypothetical protein